MSFFQFIHPIELVAHSKSGAPSSWWNKQKTAASGHGFAGHGLEEKLISFAVHIDAHMSAVENFAVEYLHRERVLNHAL